ncbi:LysR family transcriptional regulator [Sinomonas cellulolyticus]|uniref:LysR family transcriptional regulator n=1 Tax=Sinomonas cellulolyticus TaxID=2801916 RepID=A0ABS1JZ07_9MICC|nr:MULTISPECIES: LysR substrate-binding domain-containing protein [Sinomonas]MBL0704499.1 LysR family transcriptional regulator [Sinomonas cellulolyticus]GHG49030.1 LysR family transcriptional regulator [Sinomonas sp. KCTC 49339]
MAEVTLRQLELFSALPDFETLSAAAGYLHISESALSQAITGLEKTVGEQLCVRRKARGLTLTPAGQHFAVQARRILADTRELVLDARRGADLRGPVKLGCFASFATSVVPELLEGFPRRHPGVDLEITVGTNDDLLPALESGRLDVAIMYDMFLPVGYRKREIYATELEAHLHPDHPLARRRTVHLADLADEPLIHYEASPSTLNTIQAFAVHGLEPRIVARVPQIILVEALVGRGVGYGLLMSRPNVLPVSVEGRPVAVRRLDPPATRAHVVGIWPEDMALTPRAAALLDYAVEKLGCEGPGPQAGAEARPAARGMI